MIFKTLRQHRDLFVSDDQCGIRRKLSSIIQSNIYLGKVYKVPEQRQNIDVTYTGYEKTLDLVDQGILQIDFFRV